ncbi:hypothetical protein BS47DRAFT_1354127, partial [Hydnum rufescens UP504]
LQKGQQYTEEDVQQALSELSDGVHKDTTAAAKAHNIPPRTLWWRVQHGGNSSRQQTHIPQQLLTPVQVSGH